MRCDIEKICKSASLKTTLSIMRDVPLDEEDKELFGSYINRTLYDVYRKNIAAFTQMWQEQGTPYWLKFCITLRSVLQKEGYPGLLVCKWFRPSYSEEFFILLTRLLSGPNVDNVHEMIRDVVSISRFPQLWDNIAEVLLMKPESPNSCCARLFFETPDEDPEAKVFCQLPLHLRAVGCLMKLLQRWLTAKPLTAKEKLFWKPPQNWHQKKHIQTNIFEKYLQEELGSSICFLLNIQTADIAWWDESSVPPKPAMSKKHHTYLGEFIDQECLKSDAVSKVVHEAKCYDIVTSQPRGKIYLDKEAYLFGLLINTARGLFFVDDLDAFHPYSQAYISFYHSSFGPNFWYEEDGIEKHFREAFYKNRATSKSLRQEVAFIRQQRFATQNATSLNSHFYDTLHDGTTWTSAVTLIRLPWNMPLCLNWMEVLLIKIFEFERYLKPLRHFPLKKELHNILQKLLCTTEEAAFLAKAAIILAENIHQNQDHCTSMCYNLRKFLPDLIKKLANVMLFLENNAYRILNVMLKNGWSVEEQETGENHSNDCSRMLVSLTAVNSCPDIDQYFAKNFRSIYYWLGNEAVPDIENGRKYAVKVAKLIENFKSESSGENNSKSDYDFTAFQTRVQGIRGLPEVTLCFSMIDLLVEDGWISKAEEKVPHYYPTGSKDVMDELLSTQDFKRFSAAYFIAAYFLGEFGECNISGLNALARLHRAQCLAIMSDSGLKLSSMVQKQSFTQPNLPPSFKNASSTPIPPPRFFKDAFGEIHNRCAGDTDLTVEDATKLLQMIDQVKSTDLNTASEEALTDMSVPSEVELIDPAVRLRWLECFEKKRVQLLQLVSEEQFKITKACQENKNAVSRRCFPLYDILEFRLIEEAAALRKTLEMDLKPIFVHNLVRLLSYRLNWLQNAYFAWKKEKNSWKPGNRPQKFTHEQMTEMNLKNFTGILAVKHHLQAIFGTLISKYGTTHPVCEITLNQIWTEARTAYSLCSMIHGFTIHRQGPHNWEYCDSISKACAYFEQLVLHCKEVWNVPVFNCEADMEVHYGSATHAEWIVTVFQRFYVFLIWKNFLPQETAVIPPPLNKDLTESMVTAIALVTAMVAYPETVQESVTELKAILKHIWFLLVNIKKHFTFSGDSVMGFLGDKHSKWIALFKLFCRNKHSNILVKIAFSEFINASETEWNRVIKQKIHKKKEAKAGKTVCQKPQVVAKEEMIMISDDKNKDPVNQECKDTLKEKNNKPVLKESKVILKEEELIEVSHVKQPRHQQEEKVDEDNPMVLETEATVRGENVIPISDGKDKGPIHQETKVEKEEKVVMTSDVNNEQTSLVESKDLDEAASQEGSATSVEDKSESCTNKEEELVNEGSNSVLKVCKFCKKVEKNQRMFKKCHLCKKEKWGKGYFYCSENCEARDWMQMHRAAHKPE